ncbi:polynucleotide 3'-phosphatase ZDP-like isoform X1 [Acropora millepora]|uniref:polynucleotide 3'-phosphatase ZDP-like isoform X1 n=1 Tax=Acropora millepora TaxID=45264 RepID=UPI001CF2B276|nr:polynucleotide 3'-phosphatase ZDP-like isoform X1 [Acropora millepora]
MAGKGASRSIKRKIDEIEDDDTVGKQSGIKRFFEAPKTETDNEPKETTRSSGTSNLTLAWKWKESVLIYESEGVKNSNKIASFDFDGTLAKTSLFKHGPDAWSILYPSCIPTLTRFHEDGYKLVIFTNQASIGKAKATKEKVIAEKKGRLMGFVTEVGLPFQIFVATAKDAYRKPNTEMWELFSQKYNGDVKVNKDQSFFVGDAAGRKKDHGSSDKEFAENCGLKFYTEDEFFHERSA